MTSSAKGPGGRRDAHRGLGFERSGRAGVPASMSCGGARVELVEGAAAGVPRAPGLHESTRSGAVKVPRGLGRTETRQWRSIFVEAELTGNGGRGEIRWRERVGRG
jgi:hypothetical protein